MSLSNEAVKTGEKILKPVLFPFMQKALKPLREAQKLPAVLIQKTQVRLKAILSAREMSLENYVGIGRYYISKRLLLGLTLVVIVLLYFIFIKPPASLNKLFGRVPTLHASAPKTAAFTGTAKVVSDTKTPKYVGELVDGLYSGKGKLYSDNGKLLLYEGDFEKGLKAGTGTLYDDNGNMIYKGQFAADVFNGQGMLYFSGKEPKIQYNGEFQNGKEGGAGKQFYPTGELKYEGAFSAGAYSGNGKLFYPSGKIKYEGGFLANAYSGAGKLLGENGSVVYEGAFQNGNYSGDGSEFYPNGLVKYKGKFQAGIYYGEGETFTETGVPVYKGGFANGVYNGAGERYDEEGKAAYKGNFKNNAYDGLGTLLDKDGTAIVKSFFQNGHLYLQGFIGLTNQKLEELLGKPTEVAMGDANALSAGGMQQAVGDGTAAPAGASANGTAGVEAAGVSAQTARLRQSGIIVGLPKAGTQAVQQPSGETAAAGAGATAGAGSAAAPVEPPAAGSAATAADGPVKLTVAYAGYQMSFTLQTNKSNPKEAVVTDVSLWSSKALAAVQPEIESFKDPKKENELGYAVLQLNVQETAKTYSNSYFKDNVVFKLTHVNGDKTAHQLDVTTVLLQ